MSKKEIRGKSKIPKEYFDTISKIKECERIDLLKKFLNENELAFFHEFLNDYDLYSTIVTKMGEWQDICFSTAESLFAILSDSKPVERNLKELNTFLNSPNSVLHFECDGEFESHGFVVYPVELRSNSRDSQSESPNNHILLIQSAGEIMRANMRLLKVDDFKKNIKNGLFLFGYTQKDNKIDSISFKTSTRKNVSLELLIEYLKLNEKGIKKLKKLLETHYSELDSEFTTSRDDFIFDKKKSDYPYYYVNPITNKWVCVDYSTQILTSTTGIILKSVCFRIKN